MPKPITKAKARASGTPLYQLSRFDAAEFDLEEVNAVLRRLKA